jgi:hypothetical protein
MKSIKGIYKHYKGKNYEVFGVAKFVTKDCKISVKSKIHKVLNTETLDQHFIYEISGENYFIPPNSNNDNIQDTFVFYQSLYEDPVYGMNYNLSKYLRFLKV